MKRYARDKIVEFVRVMLHTHDSPERTAAAFSLGVFVACLPPVPWVHTLFALALAFIFRLNRLAVLAGSYTNTPLTMAPLIVFEAWLGLKVLGGGETPEITLRQLTTAQGWKEAFVEVRPLLGPLLLGSILVGVVASAIAYFVALRLVLLYRRRVATAAAAAAASAAAHLAAAAAAAAGVAAHAAERAAAEAHTGSADADSDRAEVSAGKAAASATEAASAARAASGAERREPPPVDSPDMPS